MKFEIVNEATESDIIEMIALDSDCYFGDDVGVFQNCNDWVKKCPSIYTILKHDNKVIGYINFMPVTKTCYDQIRSGQKKDYEVNSSEVLNFKKGDNYCFFMSIVIDKNFKSTRALGYLIDGFKNKIEKLSNKGVKITKIIADCITTEGESFAKHYNANFICKTKTGSKIYEIIIVWHKNNKTI